MERAATEGFDAIADLTSEGLKTSLKAGSAGFDEAVARFRAEHPTPSHVLVTDLRWRVTHSADGGRFGSPHPWPGDLVEWQPAETASNEGSPVTRGVLDMAGARHLAVARLLPDRQGFLVFHRPVTEIEGAAAALLKPLPAISMMALAWTCVLLGLAVYMILARFHDAAKRTRKRSAADALRHAQNLIRTRDSVIFGLAKLTESRDPETGDHLERISIYSTILATALQRYPEFSDEVTPAFVRLIGISSALHDIGKVGIGDCILIKPGPLTKAERGRMETHATIGADCLQRIEQRLGSSNFLQMAREIAVAHHERWDGSGYPYGLSGQAIPLAARIVAIADVYDALTTRRVYKPAYGHAESVETIRSQAGRHFDPRLVEVWLTLEDKYSNIARQHGPSTPDAVPGAAADVALENELETEAALQP
jgi:response regulator RpfG family c-di-GMP phosphodiesterase